MIGENESELFVKQLQWMIDALPEKEGKDKGYYFIPIYVADTIKQKLPQKAVVAAKSIDQWKEMDDEDFIFSLYPGDLVRVEHKKDIVFKSTDKNSSDTISCKNLLTYYSGANISTGAITITNHDRSYIVHGLGIKTLQLLEKYEVDVLGNYHKVRLPEKRQAFNLKYSQKKQ